MDYANTYKNVYVCFYASDMQLNVDTDAAFLVLPKACSQIVGNFQLFNDPNGNNSFNVDNGQILIECRTLRSVVTSAAESETHWVFHNAKRALPVKFLLKQMRHPQLNPISIQTDNSTSAGFFNKNMQMKASKTWDMQLHWLWGKQNMKIFKVFKDKGTNQGRDYWAKHYTTVHHRCIRLERKYVRDNPQE